MTRVIKAMLLSMLLALGLHASDLLSKATGGSISDNAFGVKELSVSEMKDVLGGYFFHRFPALDFYGGVNSTAYIVLEDDRDTLTKGPGFTDDQILLATTRQLNGFRQYYINIYNLRTGERSSYAGPRYHDMVDAFKNQLSR